MYFLIGAVAYVIFGVIKLRFYDWNNEGGWLMMMSDQRNCKFPVIVYPVLLLCYLTWPIGFFVRKFSFSECIFKLQLHLTAGL